MPPVDNNEHYRASTLGAALADSLDELINEDKIPTALAIRILRKFDAAFEEQLQSVLGLAAVKGRLKHYRHAEDVWEFVCDKAELWLDEGSEGRRSHRHGAHTGKNEDVQSVHLKVIATMASTAGEVNLKKHSKKR